MGTDSAPHPRHRKETAKSAAGVYTGAYTLAYLAHALDSFGALHRLNDFCRVFGRAFYGLEPAAPLAQEMMIERKEFALPLSIPFVDDEGVEREIVPFKAGKVLAFSKVV